MCFAKQVSNFIFVSFLSYSSAPAVAMFNPNYSPFARNYQVQPDDSRKIKELGNRYLLYNAQHTFPRLVLQYYVWNECNQDLVIEAGGNKKTSETVTQTTCWLLLLVEVLVKENIESTLIKIQVIYNFLLLFCSTFHSWLSPILTTTRTA